MAYNGAPSRGAVHTAQSADVGHRKAPRVAQTHTTKLHELEPSFVPLGDAVHERRQTSTGQNHEPASHRQTSISQERNKAELPVRP